MLSNTILTDLIHTKLYLLIGMNLNSMGKPPTEQKPHFYKSDELILDARGMDILKVEMV